MGTFVKALRRLLPRRQKRFWRYVSPQRHGAGALVLALLLLLFYGYWYLTNDRRIRREAQKYLSDLTGAKVKIDSARFSLFGGIRLGGVKVFVPGEDPQHPFFRAGSVLLRHRPWGLLTTGKVQPTDILCDDTAVRIAIDTRDEAGSTGRLLVESRRRGFTGAELEANLPLIRVRNCRLDIAYVGPDAREVELNLDIALVPDPAGKYVIRYEEPRARQGGAIRGEVLVDLQTGQFSYEGQWALRPGLLPEKYDQWLKRYRVAGTVRLPKQPATTVAGRGIVAELVDFALRLPPAEGGLELTGVNGQIEFQEGKVILRRIAGKIPQAGDAQFTMSGEYAGYKPDSPFLISLSVTDMELPRAENASGAMAEALTRLHKDYQPRGKVNFEGQFARLSDGSQRFRGAVRPAGMTVTYRHFPYRLENLTGEIAFSSDGTLRPDLSATRGDTKLRIRGEMPFSYGGPSDLTVEVVNGRFDDDLRDALPKEYRDTWDLVNPTGRANVHVRVVKKDADSPEQATVTLVLDGRAGCRYADFPYPVENVSGEIRITDRTVDFESVRGGRGTMKCRLDGQIVDAGLATQDTRLRIRAWKLPFDKALAGALGKEGRAAFESLHATGQADYLDARVTYTEEKGTDYAVNVTLAEADDVRLKMDALPLALSGVAGELTVDPQRVIVKRLTARRGETPLTLSGLVDGLGGETMGLDLSVRATGLAVDDELRAALPAPVRREWDTFSPGGTADVDLTLRYNLPRADDLDYTLTVNAHDMQVRYRDFPYTFRHLRGRMIASPGQLRLEDLHAAEGKMRAVLDGTVRTDDETETARLRVRADNVPIDAELLGALPEELAPLVQRIRAGGTCSLDLKELEVVRPVGAAATQPAETQPATDTAPATAPRPGGAWSLDGSVAFREAVIDFGLGAETLTGVVKGVGGRTAKGVSLDAHVAIDRLQVGKREITDLTGTLLKHPSGSLIVLKDLSAGAHGGKVTGRAEFRLTDPLEYGLSLTVASADLGELFNAGVTDPKKRADVKGALDGTLQLKGTAGKSATRQAVGVLRISRGKLYKLPILLGFLHVMYLSVPGDSAFTDGFISYHLRDDVLMFREIHLTGSALSIVGSGSMDMKTEKLRLNFLTGPPGKMPRLDQIADEFLTGLAREIVEIRVTGTLSKPQTRTVSLRGFDEAIRRLLSPPPPEP
ncbi:MAG TPA: hypothetical protein DCX07_01120 [Phycisphaerales bacterium]|nr:hypothetical protein [Phycisphaerales bacterium]